MRAVCLLVKQGTLARFIDVLLLQGSSVFGALQCERRIAGATLQVGHAAGPLSWI